MQRHGAGLAAISATSCAFSNSRAAMQSFVQGWYRPVLDRADHRRDPALDRGQPAVEPGPIRRGRSGQGRALLLPRTR